MRESEGDTFGTRLRTNVDVDAEIEIFPSTVAKRLTRALRGIAVELVHTVRYERTEIRYRGMRHLLIVHEQGIRTDGETVLEGAPRSSLRDVTQKLTFVPAGHDYRDWQEPRALARTVYVYFDPSEMPIDPSTRGGHIALVPRLFFGNSTLWDTASRLKALVETGGTVNSRYCEALGVVLAHEIVRMNSYTPSINLPARGGLATWQQRIVTTYIDAHLTESIPLPKLAALARLSPLLFLPSLQAVFRHAAAPLSHEPTHRARQGIARGARTFRHRNRIGARVQRGELVHGSVPEADGIDPDGIRPNVCIGGVRASGLVLRRRRTGPVSGVPI